MRILPLAAPIFVAALPIIGKVFVTGAAIVVSGFTINESNKEYNKITSRLNAAQRAKVEAEKAKATKKKKAKASDKERSTDVPSWARGEKPKKGENGKDFADRLMNGKYGKGKWSRASKEYSQLKKFGDRGGK